MNLDEPIESVMTPLPHTVGQEQTISHALEMMQEHRVRHLPVLHGGQLVGVVSDRDLGLIAGLNAVNPEATIVEEAMTAEPYTVTKSTSIREVVMSMKEHKYGSTVVVEGNKVAGIFTTSDAVALLVAS